MHPLAARHLRMFSNQLLVAATHPHPQRGKRARQASGQGLAALASAIRADSRNLPAVSVVTGTLSA